MSKQKILSLVVLPVAVCAVILSYILTQSGFGNKDLEKAINGYLLTQNYFSWKNQLNSRNYCAVENLNPGSESFPVYVWALCEELSMENGALKIVSGSSGPVKINYSGFSGDYDLKNISHEAPSDGSLYAEDVKRIFPLNVQLRIMAHDISPLESKLQKIAREDFARSGNISDIFNADPEIINLFN